jgi:squalene-hopene/tetraprenyl-beta-curcumene cyclase
LPITTLRSILPPPTTARVQCLGRFGWPADHPAVQKAVKYLLKDQCGDGSWFGRWGVNYVYGTSGVLRALETVSLTAQEYCQRAVAWLKSVQQDDGSFGESLKTYSDVSSKGQGASTPSQTAWGLIGLLAGANTSDPAITRAVSYLVGNQNEDSSWASRTSRHRFPAFFIEISPVAIPSSIRGYRITTIRPAEPTILRQQFQPTSSGCAPGI